MIDRASIEEGASARAKRKFLVLGKVTCLVVEHNKKIPPTREAWETGGKRTKNRSSRRASNNNNNNNNNSNMGKGASGNVIYIKSEEQFNELINAGKPVSFSRKPKPFRSASACPDLRKANTDFRGESYFT